MYQLDGWARISIVGGYVSGTVEGGCMGDNLTLFGEVLGLFGCFVYIIITSFIFMLKGLG